MSGKLTLNNLLLIEERKMWWYECENNSLGGNRQCASG